MTSSDRTEELRRLRREALKSGGPERIAARRKREAKTARQRVVDLLDHGTFVEVDLLVGGVVVGYGKIAGRDVYVFSEDGEALAGAADPGAVGKITKIIDLAMKNGAPVIGLYDCGQIRGGEGRDARTPEEDGREGPPETEEAEVQGEVDAVFRSVMASGLVPQIAAVMGPCLGGGALSPAMADFIIMVKGSSHLLLTDPRTAGPTTESATLEGLGGAKVNSERSGVAHLAVDNESQCLQTIRRLLSHMPQNNLEETPRRETNDPADRVDDELDSLLPLDADESYDLRNVVTRVVDDGEFFEIMPYWAQNLVTGFAHLGGRSVGIVGNQPTHLGGRLDIDASTKGARFVRFCDAFNIPLLTFVDSPGFVPGGAQEHSGIVRSVGKLLYSYCEATVPKMSVITGRAYGGAYAIMCPKEARADFSFAWPSAEITVGGSPYAAARSGHLDDVIEPQETRQRLMAALEACVSKREGRPPKKHGNIPL